MTIPARMGDFMSWRRRRPVFCLASKTMDIVISPIFAELGISSTPGMKRPSQTGVLFMRQDDLMIELHKVPSRGKKFARQRVAIFSQLLPMFGAETARRMRI